MLYSKKIKDAIRMAIRVHELDQKQKRRGKDVPYIIHPLIVGMILGRVSRDEDVIVAGILHDTIEDSVVEKKVTRDLLEKRFGKTVSDMVWDVTEEEQKLPWEERKRRALDKLKRMGKSSLLVKSADTIANCSELIADYNKEGDNTFRRFTVPKDKQVGHYIKILETIKTLWPANPLRDDLSHNLDELREILTTTSSKEETRSKSENK